jgi:hypothetical protein
MFWSRPEAIPPSQEYVSYLSIVTWVGAHSYVLRAQPKQIIGDILSVGRAFEKSTYLGNVPFIFVPGFRDPSYADRIPHIMEDFVDSAEKLFVMWQKVQCLIPDKADRSVGQVVHAYALQSVR